MEDESELSGPRLFYSIQPRSLLSFGRETEAIALKSLNVLIGPNGAGKSNLIETIALLRSAPHDAPPRDFRTTISRGGGIREWIWKGQPEGVASLEVVVGHGGESRSIVHALQFREENQAARLDSELIRLTGLEREDVFFVRAHDHRAMIRSRGDLRKLRSETFDPSLSILAQRKDPELYPEISKLASLYGAIRVYREWSFGRNTIFRKPQPADLRSDSLEEDFSNLSLFLNRLRRFPKAKSRILDCLLDLYEGVTDFDVNIEGGNVQIVFLESEFSIPATRLSDGTLRYLCLLAILCDPEPPPLICIEEPELGLHPDVLPTIADLLIEASSRTQLIVTTHSDVLVDAMSETPESVVVCEKHDGQSSMQRLNADKLQEWLKKYRLGQLWIQGELGGKRW